LVPHVDAPVDNHEPGHPLGMGGREADRDVGAQGVADQHRLLEAEVIEEPEQILAVVREAVAGLGLVALAPPPEIVGDQAVGGREHVGHARPAGVVRGQPVDADHRRALAGSRPLRDRERDVVLERDAGDGRHRLFMIGGAVSWRLSSRTSVGTSHATSGFATILNEYMLWRAWWSSLRKIILPLGVWNSRPSIAAMSFSVSVPPAFWIPATTAIAAANPPQVKKSGGSLKRFMCSRTSQSFTGFLGIS